MTLGLKTIHTRSVSLFAFCSVTASLVLAGCSAESPPPGPPTGGTGGTAGGAGGTVGGGGVAGANVAGANVAGANVAGASSGAGGATSGAGGGGGSAVFGGAAGSSGSSGANAAGAGGKSVGGTGGAGGSGGKGGAAGATAGGSGGMSSGGKSAGCGKAPTIPSSMYNNGNPISITAANRQRRYILSVPTNYDNSKAYNLVIAWHQLDGNDKQMYQQNFYWLKDIPEAASSTIFVAPNGEKGGNPCTGMNVAESGCGWPDSNGSNVALADAVVAQIEENFCIDKSRIFANGWSYGGSMSYRTACSRPLGGTANWGVRGVAVYNGAAQLSSGGCSPSKSVAFYTSHGTNDNVLGYDGGVSMATTFARLNGCTAMTPTRASGNMKVCTNYMGCMAGYPVEFCSFVGGHTPDPPREGGQRWQPQEVWKFFSGL
ncbi:MAG TPA: hypothetical protein VIM73_10240 [Polyangiaceae bacterium]